MSWTPLAVAPTPAFVQAFALAQTALANLPTALMAVRGTLESAPAIDGPYGDASLNQLLTPTIAPALQFALIHPWLEGVGQGNGHYRYLAPANAIQALARKLSDARDSFGSVNTPKDALVVLITGGSYRELSLQLSAFSLLYDLTDLRMLANRCKALADLENTKQQLPGPLSNIHWRAATALTSPSLKKVVKSLDHAIGHLDGQRQKNQSPDDELAALAEKKAAAISQALQDAQGRLKTLVGAVGQSLFFSNKPLTTIKRSLLDSGSSFASPLCVCLGFFGEAGTLKPLKELFHAAE